MILLLAVILIGDAIFVLRLAISSKSGLRTITVKRRAILIV